LDSSVKGRAVKTGKQKKVRASGKCANPACKRFFRRSYSIDIYKVPHGKDLMVHQSFQSYYGETSQYCTISCVPLERLLVLRQTGYWPAVRESPQFLVVDQNTWKKVYALTGWNFEIEADFIVEGLLQIEVGKCITYPIQIMDLVVSILPQHDRLDCMEVQGYCVVGNKQDIKNIRDNFDVAVAKMRDMGLDMDELDG